MAANESLAAGFCITYQFELVGANETVSNLLDDYANGRLGTPASPAPEAVDAFLAERGVRYTTWDGWYRLDAAEKALGEPQGRERVKIVEREDMLRESGA